MTIALITLAIILYVSGGILMRAFLKTADADDQDSWKPIVFWPYYPLASVLELLWMRKFKW